MFIIMAANGKETDFTIWLQRQNFKFSVLEGVYRSSREVSFKIQLDYLLDKAIVIDKAKKMNQESILLINKGKASLHYLDTGFSVNLGEWLNVERDDAIKSQSYSYDLRERKYYLAA